MMSVFSPFLHSFNIYWTHCGPSKNPHSPWSKAACSLSGRHLQMQGDNSWEGPQYLAQVLPKHMTPTLRLGAEPLHLFPCPFLSGDWAYSTAISHLLTQLPQQTIATWGQTLRLSHLLLYPQYSHRAWHMADIQILVMKWTKRHSGKLLIDWLRFWGIGR